MEEFILKHVNDFTRIPQECGQTKISVMTAFCNYVRNIIITNQTGHTLKRLDVFHKANQTSFKHQTELCHGRGQITSLLIMDFISSPLYTLSWHGERSWDNAK